MTAVLTLGLRLARAGGRLRAWSIVAGNAFGVVLLLVVVALPAALFPDQVERAQNRVGVLGALLFLLVPTVILLVTVGRLSSGVRDRRLASLRLLGLAPWRTRAVAAVENGALALVGVLLGVAIFLALRPVASDLLVSRGLLEAPLRSSAAVLAGIAAGVVVLSVLVGTASTWERELPGRARAEATRRRPGTWRVAVLLLGLGMLVGLWLVEPNTQLQSWLFAPLLLGGGVLTAVGIALTTPLIASWCASGLVRSNRVGARLAGRAIQTDPAGPSRVVAGLGVATFLAVGALGFLGMYANMPTYRYATQVLGEGPQRMGVYDVDGDPLEDVDELARMPGIQAVIPDHDVAIPCGELPGSPDQGGAELCGGEVFVGTCAELSLTMTMTGCDDSRPARIEADSTSEDEDWWWKTDPLTSSRIDIVVDPDGTAIRRTIDLSGDPITLDVRATVDEWVWLPSGLVFIPEHLLAGDLGPITSVRLNATGGAAVQERVAAWAAARDYISFANPMSDFQRIQNARLIVWALCAVALATGLALFALTAADRARERRRQVARQIMVGVPSRVLRAGQSLQLVIPVLATSALSLFAGLVLARGYTRQAQVVIGDGNGEVLTGLAQTVALIGPRSWAVLGGMIALAVLLAVGSTVPLIRTRLRPELLRRE